MDTKQTNRMNMYQATIAVLDAGNAIWSSMAPFGSAVSDFKSKVLAIGAAATQQELPTGATKEKSDARDDLEEVLFLMCEALGVLAHEADDHALHALTNMTMSGLRKIDAERLSNLATSVLAQANAKKTELATMQVTQANIDELTQALADFNEAKTAPREAAVARTSHTESLTTLFRQANDILNNRLDRMVSLFSRTNPEFVSQYQAARAIVDRPATHATSSAAPTPAAPPA